MIRRPWPSASPPPSASPANECWAAKDHPAIAPPPGLCTCDDAELFGNVYGLGTFPGEVVTTNCIDKAVAEIAKPGDLILAHDYAPSRQVFINQFRGKRWNWSEITDVDLPASGFQVIESPGMREALWFCGVVV